MRPRCSTIETGILPPLAAPTAKAWHRDRQYVVIRRKGRVEPLLLLSKRHQMRGPVIPPGRPSPTLLLWSGSFYGCADVPRSAAASRPAPHPRLQHSDRRRKESRGRRSAANISTRTPQMITYGNPGVDAARQVHEV